MCYTVYLQNVKVIRNDIQKVLEMIKADSPVYVSIAPAFVSRLFPTTGGILKSMRCENGNYTYLAIDGVENCINDQKRKAAKMLY